MDFFCHMTETWWDHRQVHGMYMVYPPNDVKTHTLFLIDSHLHQKDVFHDRGVSPRTVFSFESTQVQVYR
jgi:hypothetical protein